MSKSLVGTKSIAFAIRIINLYEFLCQHQKEFVLSKQLLRSGTSIGALIREAEHGQSKADFLNKMNIALKEANECDYWLLLLREGVYLQTSEYNSIQKDCDELIKLLVAIVKTTKSNLKKVANRVHG
ncbi:four helix bundle protein [Pinibacter aurantiacus]|uniref:Four helix bundle protein n=1 Tax=Pinibacter aurantiacus TaxID=2851599 RepID=A0A9E2W7N7_9BACT|nr:four helix bundle protein [Pinibacter aurantiacus]MBV4356597.1 four helix bundle protein [Pinibacter aurantiacus]